MSGTVERKDDFVVKDAAGRERLQCAALTIIPDSGTAARDSVLCLGTVNDKFLKCRINDQPAGRGRSAALSHRLDAAAVSAAVNRLFRFAVLVRLRLLPLLLLLRLRDRFRRRRRKVRNVGGFVHLLLLRLRDRLRRRRRKVRSAVGFVRLIQTLHRPRRQLLCKLQVSLAASFQGQREEPLCPLP